MSTSMRLTTADVELMPDDGRRYEIIDGVLYVAKAPSWYHQFTCDNAVELIRRWNDRTRLGRVTSAPGIIFTEFDNVIPDVVWVSNQRFATGLDAAGHLIATPELIVEVLSFGDDNERRDREVKLKLYSHVGVEEYWLPDWRAQTVTVYRREGNTLRLVATPNATDTLTTPTLPGFSCLVSEFFRDLPSTPVGGE